ncbi:hypothetical protein MMC30_006844 [Trapelia coarctata]|nr:hypothetical protein [Trapelia coarctata]
MQQPKSSESSQAPFTSCTSELSLVSLPHEIRVAIFSFLPDVSSVKALALTCSLFLHTFGSAESVVLDSVLRAQIDPGLWSLVLTVLDSSSLEPWSREGVLRCLTEPDNKRVPRQCTSWEALALSELQKHVQFFADDFASSALATASPNQASPMEMHRIQRAFYRFELYCNLFRSRKGFREERFSAQEQRDHFFAKFCPWEIEQLACIHDYLFERLCLPFNEVAEHDIEWGELSIPFANDWDEPDNVWKEHYLSLGLAYLYRAITAANYEDRYQLISPNLGSDELFLFEGMKSQEEEDDVPLVEFSSDEKDKYFRRHLAVDNGLMLIALRRASILVMVKGNFEAGDMSCGTMPGFPDRLSSANRGTDIWARSFVGKAMMALTDRCGNHSRRDQKYGSAEVGVGGAQGMKVRFNGSGERLRRRNKSRFALWLPRSHGPHGCRI